MSRSILLAEDENAVAQFLLEALRLEGHAVEWASDGARAIEVFDPERFALLLTDLFMPRVDGPTLIRHVRRLDPGFPVVVLSGSDAAQELATFGVDAYLAKPIALEELLTTADRLVRGRATPPERRGFPRRPVEIPVTLADETSSWCGRMVDISQDGMAIALGEAAAEQLTGSSYRAYFRRRDGRPVDLELLLARHSAEGDRVGFRFGALTRSQQGSISDVICRS